MKKNRGAEQSSYVKRIKLKKSILKTNQILQTISIFDNESKIGSTQRDTQHHLNDAQFTDQLRKITKDKITILDTQLCKNQINIVKFNHMKKILNVCQSKSKKQQEEDQINIKGMEIRRIIGDPFHKRQSTQHLRKPSLRKSIKKGNNEVSLALTVSKQFNNDLDYPSPPTYKSQICSSKTPRHRSIDLKKQTERSLQNCKTPSSPTRKNKVYLYEKMAGTENKVRDQCNYVYEKRIKSFTQFLWKCLIAHNIYINLDLAHPPNSIRKLKAFVGYGNNCNMIKGLIKRRYWWSVSEELTDDCMFVWTQLKINKIFQRQASSEQNQTLYYSQQSQNLRKLVKTCAPGRRKNAIQNIFGRVSIKQKQSLVQKRQKIMENISKIWNQQDMKFLQQFCGDGQPLQLQKWQNLKRKQLSYASKIKLVNQKYKKINCLDKLYYLQQEKQDFQHNYYQAKPLVHNHLQNNFHLGNKKALFYNLQQYYRKVGEDLFHYIPLTFHIKHGFTDKQYKRFIEFYQKRNRIIKRQDQNQQKKLNKTRNIWIVKPGENSNQGRGITVIDQIYQLNNIIKQTEKSTKSLNKNSKSKNESQKDSQRTFIVQMYIDRPMLYNQRKFDIRHYMLITNLYGVMRAYWYEQGYIRTSSYNFNIHNFEPQIHLTNDAIQKQYPDYGKYQPYNKISYTEFQNHLNTLPDRKYNFKQEVLTKMKKMGKDAAKSIYTKISPKQQLNNFQIFGLDFMIDRNFKPWLIEINTNPCLDCVCPLLDRIIPYMVEQSLKLSLDLVYPPPFHYPNTSKHYAPFINLQNFKYELIFDSLSQGQDLTRLYSQSSNILVDIGQISEDEQFNDNGKEIKLQDFT